MNIYIKTVLISFALSACTPAQLAPIEQSSDVYGASLGDFRLANPTSVCWIDEGEDAKKEWVKQAIANSWSKYAAIDFIGWDSCSNLNHENLARTIRLGWKRKRNCTNEEENLVCEEALGWALIGFSPEFIEMTFPQKKNC